MAANNGAFGDADRRVIPFRTRARVPILSSRRIPSDLLDSASPVSDLSEFECQPERDNYCHRMTVNAAALVTTLMLMAAGIWIAESMAAMRKSQDCVLMGRRNCTAATVLPTDRGSGSAPVELRAASDRQR